jgi:hypothetical protein
LAEAKGSSSSQEEGGDEPAVIVDAHDAAELKRLLKACPKVNSVAIPGLQSPLGILKQCSRAPFAGELKDLSLFQFQIEGMDVARLAEEIARFRQRTSLTARGMSFCPSESPCRCSAIKVQQLVPIHTLGLHFLEDTDCDFAPSAYKAILAVIGPATLHECHIDVSYGKMSCIDSLRCFPHLAHLSIHFSSALEVQSSLKRLQSCISGFSSLCSLEVFPEPRFTEEPLDIPALRAPASINEFFQSLPNSLCRVFVGGVYFADVISLPKFRVRPIHIEHAVFCGYGST